MDNLEQPDPSVFDGHVESLTTEYDQAREEFDFGFIVVGTIMVLFLLWISGVTSRWGEKKEPVEENDTKTPWTLKQIRERTGPDGKIFIGCNNYVFDVSDSDNFKKGGFYEEFAGHDISIACAHYSTETKYLDIPYDEAENDLTFDKQQKLQGFFMQFCQKYDIKGRVVWSSEEQTAKKEE